jgi:hypothetical protein
MMSLIVFVVVPTAAGIMAGSLMAGVHREEKAGNPTLKGRGLAASGAGPINCSSCSPSF